MKQCSPIAIPEGLCSPADRLTGRCGESLKNWFRVENASTGTDASEAVDIVIDGPIVDQFMAEFLGIGTSAADVVAAIMSFRGRPLNIWINSEGGLIQDGLGIYNQLLMHDAPVTTIVYGFAMSIASVIAMAGGTRIMAPTSALFIHEAQGFIDGSPADIRQYALLLEQMSAQLADVYASRGDSRVNWRALMQAGSGPAQGAFITAEEAVRRKLADRIDTNITRQPTNALDLGAYAVVTRLDQLNPIEDLPPVEMEEETEPALTIRVAERVLREAGFGNNRAKTIVAKGWQEADRDDPPESSGMDESEPDAEDAETVETPSAAAQALTLARQREAYIASMPWATPMMKG